MTLILMMRRGIHLRGIRSFSSKQRSSRKQKAKLRQIRVGERQEKLKAELDEFRFERQPTQKYTSSRTVENRPRYGNPRSELLSRMNQNSRYLKGFKPFFEEVDEHMAKMKNHKEKNSAPASLASFLASLGDLPESENNQNEKQEQPSLWDSSGSGNQYIFDVFAISKNQVSPAPNSFDDEIYEQYKSMMEEVIDNRSFNLRHTQKPLKESYLKAIVGWLLKDSKVMDSKLSSLSELMKDGLSLDDSIRGEQTRLLKSQLDEQAEAFLDRTKMTKDQYKTSVKALRMLGHLCAKRARGNVLDIAWEKIKEAGIVLDEQALNNYLYVASTTGGRWSLSLTKRGRKSPRFGDGAGHMSVLDIFDKRQDDDPEEDEIEESEDDFVDLAGEIATVHDLLYKPSEQSVGMRVKSLVANGKGEEAESLLNSFDDDNGVLRLRSYLPVLRLYCESGKVGEALRLFKKMHNTPTVVIEPETYVQLISAVAENGYFVPGSAPVPGAEDLGYPVGSGPGLFDHLASEMSDEVVEITSASSRRLYNAFLTSFRGTSAARNLKEMHALAPLPKTMDRADEDELVLNKVSVDSASALCPRTGAKLRLIGLEQDQRVKLYESLLDMSQLRYDHNRGTVRDLDYAVSQLRNFAEMLDKREGEPFTAIVDGANVAYHMQNFEQGMFNFHQIKFMVDALERMNENPLVIIPYKYSTKRFYVGTNSKEKQILSKEEIQIRQTLRERGQLYMVPAGCLDDYYWILASVSNQTVSRRGRDLKVELGDANGRWPGARPMIITNDNMRDHKLQMMEPRLFQRWYSCHIVNYHFTGFVGSESVDREIGFATADFFTREIQGNESPGVSIRSTGTAWHFPISDWDLDDRFCIRIPSHSKN
mmetsp:Transcript_17996/g.27510  ORF Transcript_17996/g.27510 Transcript_17996/m.27510 type:complete len:876 (+) Transcript_17996:496-3123(+)